MTEKTFDMRALWRVIIWGSCAAVAVSGVVMLGETDSGARRLQVALDAITDPGAGSGNTAMTPVASLTPPVERRNVELENETRRLNETVRALSGDRDRLAARVASLESSIADMTGSIKDMTSAIVKESRSAPAEVQQHPPQPQQAPQPASVPLPQPSPVASAQPIVSPPSSLPSPPPTTTALVVHRMPPTSLDGARAEFPEPPKTTASIATAAEPPAAPEPAKPKPGIGVDIGGAFSMESLQLLWATVKANHGPLFAGLQPYVSTQLTRAGKQEYRLVLGPMSNSATAGRYCTMLGAARMACRPVTYDAQQRLTAQ